jgi:hypothetical protein
MAPTATQVRNRVRSAGPSVSSVRSSRRVSAGAGVPSRQGAPRRSTGSQRATQGLTDVAALESVRDVNRAVGKYTGSTHTAGLIAEYIAGMVLIAWGIFTGQKDYLEAMSEAMWRMTALTFVFFVLALVARGDKSGKAALAFGAIVDLGILFHATQTNVIKTMGNVIAGQGTGVDNTTLTADIQTTEPTRTAIFPSQTSGDTSSNVSAV